MILLDANFLITVTQKSCDHAWLTLFFEYISENHSREAVGIPAPAWAEVLAMAGPGATSLSKIVQGRTAVQVIPFDEIAAIESGHVHRRIVSQTGTKKGASTAPWQRIKIDRQILAIAVARKATAIFTDDEGLCADAAIIGMMTIGIGDVLFPPCQIGLFPEDICPDD